MPAARSRAGAAGRSTPRGLDGTTLHDEADGQERVVRHHGAHADEYGIADGPQRVRLFNTDLDAVAAALHSRYSRESALKMCSRDADEHRS